MQTFLPYSSFTQSARVLDYRRLGKQRVECKQILIALQNKAVGIKSGWQNHPATLMWAGYEKSLCYYGFIICKEWQNRGYKDTLLPYFEKQYKCYDGSLTPCWWNWEPLHSSHRARLLEKDIKHYGQFNWSEQPVGPEGYVRPIDKNGQLHPWLESYSIRKA